MSALVAVGAWIGKYAQQIKICFAIIAAIWILVEYTGKQQEARVEHSLDYVKQLSEGELLAADIRLTQFWVKKSTVQKLESLPKGDKKAYADFLIDSVDSSLTAEVWQLFNFFKNLSICVNTRICDAATACTRFRRDIEAFLQSYEPYFERYKSIFHDDAFEPIRKMLSDEACKSSSQ